MGRGRNNRKKGREAQRGMCVGGEENLWALWREGERGGCGGGERRDGYSRKP